ncbi:MAG: efflux RND transporter permease subunit [Syntrophomonas sp.]
MKIVNLAVKRPVSMIIILSIILVLGMFTFSKLSVDLYPDMQLPIAAVITNYSGAGPEEVESQVSKPLESTLSTLSNVKKIESRSSSGNSLIIIRYNWGTNMDTAVNDVREKTSMVEQYLPSGADKPTVYKMDPTMMPIIQIGISGQDMTLAQLQSFADDVIEPRLSRVPEIASVYITGGLEREVKVKINRTRLENYGLSLGSVNQVLAAENFNVSAGKVQEGSGEYYVRNLQQFESVDDIKNVAITTSTGNTIFLSDIAEITDGYKDDTQLTRVDGGPAVGIHCMKQSSANTVKACEAVQAELDTIKQQYGKNLDIKVVYDQSTFIRQTLNSTQRMMIEGSLLAILILYLFLRNARSTVIVFTAIPISIISTFILLYFNNETLNVITMGGLALGIGRMVDDSIVVFENIFRHRSEGEGLIEAALNGASEVGNAVVASTMTILAVFAPIAFSGGLAGILFKPLALTVCFAIFCSLMVSLTIIPLMSSRLLSDQAMHPNHLGSQRLTKVIDGFGGWLDSLGEKYKELLRWSLGHRRRVVSIVAVLMVVSICVIPLVGAEFMASMDSGDIAITIDTDKGSLLADTDKLVSQIESKLHEVPEVNTIFTSVGSTGNMLATGSGAQGDKASIAIKLVPLSDRKRSVEQVTEDIRQRLADVPGAKIKVSVSSQMTGSSGSSASISVQIKGDELDQLSALSKQAEEIIRSVPGTREIRSSMEDGSPEIQIKVDRQRAAAYGLTPGQISSEVKNAMQGTVSTRYRVEGEEVDVRVLYAPDQEVNLENLGSINILSSKGMPVQLSQVAEFRMEPGPVQIRRIDKVRQVVIEGDLLDRDLNSVMADIKTQLGQRLILPNGYSIEYGGQNQDMIDSFKDLGLALLLAIVLVYGVMAVLYESFFNPFIIMFSVPTAFVGVILALLITGKTLNVSSFIGVIMLVGIVVANAIVYVDYLQQLRERGMERDLAIMEAGRVRLRPILMTAFATILAMFPLALGLGEGGESEAPLAITIIGGLTVSTFVTLLLVPVMYSLLDDRLGKFRNWRKARKERKETAGKAIDTVPEAEA